MKVTPDHLSALTVAIDKLDTASVRAAYRDGCFPRADACRDVNMRYRWDLLWAACKDSPELVNPVLDAGYKDAHLDTALRSIVADVRPA